MTTENRLARETSPYLLQHAKNPVDWYPWGAEALRRAEVEDKPILLSVGYAACHWCHVMERECFENEDIAAAMNAHFVCIKVDREERPDIDDIYMTATVAMTGRGGWPMTVFLTPEQAPFFAGTYFPPDDRHGQLGFRNLLRRIAELWEGERDQLFRQAGELSDYVRRQSELDPPTSVTGRVLERATEQLARSFDPVFGGFGEAPKFPPSQALHLLLRHHARTGDKHALTMLTTTLDGMKDGGIYDQLAGGFARYSTDERWLVPHFEKMLYDNAQLARVYLEAYQVTGNWEYRRVASETLDYILREMQAPEGGYYSATDADSEGVEGKYFTFTTKQLRSILEAEEVRAFCAYYGVTEAGNWEGTNVLHTPRPSKDVAADLALTPGELEQLVATARNKVLRARQTRVPPLLDDKVITSWNGLMMGTMAEAARVLGNPAYLESAKRAMAFIQRTLVTDEGRLLRTARGGTAHLHAYLEDYAYLADALVDVYEASGAPEPLGLAQDLCERLLADFQDSGTGAFFQTAVDHEELLVRTRDGNDGALPNANAVAARALLRVGEQLGLERHREAAAAALRAYGQRIEKLPRAYLTSLNVLDLMLGDPVQLVFAGEWSATAELRKAVAAQYVAPRVIAHAVPGVQATALTRGKHTLGDKPVLYICRNRVCERPITSPAAVADQLRNAMVSHDAQRRPALATTPTTGRASAEGTRRYHGRQRTDDSAIHALGDTGLLVSRIGFGGYRLHKELPDHQRALMLALQSGCNLVDTAASYTRGGSERTVGDALAELLRKGSVARDEVVIVSKLGMLQTAELPAGAVALEPGLAYSLEPELLERQLAESLQRLNLETLDVCLLHNPETLLQTANAKGDPPQPPLNRAELRHRLARACAWLEDKVAAGSVAWHGISTSALVTSEAEPVLGAHGIGMHDLEQVARQAPHFRVLQLPLNPLETRAATDGAIARASELGWAVLANRPLNALIDGELWRLADAPEQPDAPELGPHRTALAMLEQEFRQSIGAVLQAVPDAQLPAGELLTWSERIGAAELRSRAAWNEFERSELAPELSRVLAGLDHAFAGKELGQLWRGFKKRYTEQLESCVLAARNAASTRSNDRNRPIVSALSSQPGAAADAALAQRVVWTLGSLPGVCSVLVGMREPSYVGQLLATLRWDAAEQPLAALLAAEAAGRSA